MSWNAGATRAQRLRSISPEPSWAGGCGGGGGGAHLLVDDEQDAQRDAVGREHVVARRDLALQVRDQRVRQVAHAALVPVWRARRALVSETCRHDTCDRASERCQRDARGTPASARRPIPALAPA